MNLKTGIILVNWNGLHDTKECLKSLRAVSGKKDIIVVDNASTHDEASELEKSFPDITVMRLDQNYGFSAANNRGIELALARGCDAIVILNNDTLVTADFLAHLESASNSNPQAGILAPKIFFPDTTKIWAAGGAIHYILARGMNRGEGKDDAQVHVDAHPDFISGCCMYIPARVAQQLRFDEKYFLYFEDADLSLRARDLGYQLLYVPESIIYHKSGRSSGPLLSYRRIYYLSRNKLLFARLRFTTVQKLVFWLVYPFQTLGMFSYFLLKTSWSTAWQLMTAWIRGLRDFTNSRFGRLEE